jgi:hypothetical protein
MSLADAEGVSARAFDALQYLLPQQLLSQLVHELPGRLPWPKNALIRGFIGHFFTPTSLMPRILTPGIAKSGNHDT